MVECVCGSHSDTPFTNQLIANQLMFTLCRGRVPLVGCAVDLVIGVSWIIDHHLWGFSQLITVISWVVDHVT